MRNILAIVIGLFAGGIVNMGIVLISNKIIPPPISSNLTTTEGLKAAMSQMKVIHFLMPFLAHAIGTFIGSFFAALIAAKEKMRFAIVISLIFLSGGIADAIMLPSPIWFIITDTVLAYLPLGFLAGRLSLLLFKKQI